MKTTLKIATLLLTLFIVGCGQDKKKKEGFEYQQQTEKETPAATESKSQNEIVITADDMMKYNKKEIRVKAGEKVTLTLKHIGKLDKKVMGHNWVLLKQGVDLVDFATEATTAMNNEYIPEGSEDFIVHTKLLGGGESDTITFDAPEPGTYQFLCSFPGHYGMMQGTFIVE
ncbi:azurin [Robertkochia solimangrovi]|uniref:azurin n=1 Tax=Robertkochia solimangrovi TaxID=2213046 RepID=UPI0018F03869|nr:azurin [Robertkochia solimangrovi]